MLWHHHVASTEDVLRRDNSNDATESLLGCRRANPHRAPTERRHAVATKNGGKRPSRRAPSPPKHAEPPAPAAPRRRKRAERAAGAPTTRQAEAGAPPASRDLSAPALARAERPRAESP